MPQRVDLAFDNSHPYVRLSIDQSVHNLTLGKGEFGEGLARLVHIRPTDEGLDVCGLSERTSWSPAISAAIGGLTRRQQPQGPPLPFPRPRAFLYRCDEMSRSPFDSLAPVRLLCDMQRGSLEA